MSDIPENPPAGDGGHGDVPYTPPPVFDPSQPGNPGVPPILPSAADLAYIRSELDAIKFSIVAGVSNGLDRIGALLRYIETRM